ncbi:hypothetical protein GQ43DRAFT_409336 [Delitschia confertaspora ATCC 74209]|uniref:BSD domain-containing protein n=1 Tax=Delitschia confertaspora ATCC 74209 TaxID=1513339 RepID=A0A9P4JS32_9PLEO|nr:hypothetical protein GQ43DRAFT_409336 [Delitschia confertaspora ATCC 74209]
MSEAATSYKKKDGKLSLSLDGKIVSWKANDASLPPLSIDVSEVTNLQQTPESAKKVSIKIVLQKPGAAEPENHTFTFTSPNARAEQATITGLLRKSIETSRAQKEAAVAPAVDDGRRPAALAIAQAVSSNTRAEDTTYDDSRLIGDTELQRSLLNANPALRQRFNQALREKPETITIGQFGTQFWSTRVHLLRSHAAERRQSQGAYNVLSEVKPQSVDGVTKLSLSKEQIQLIFKQHPLVKRVYNENLPPLSEKDFWQRFFGSRLFKKLKGEKINETDPTDPKLDKYLNLHDEVEQTRQSDTESVPHFIDLRGNEQNSSELSGNRQDFTMVPQANEKVPILRVLNRMSEKMMADVPPSDLQAHGPVGIDEDTFKELQLRDLQRSTEDNRVVLNVQNQSEFFSVNQGVQNSSSAAVYAKRTPIQVTGMMQGDIHRLSSRQNASTFDLEYTIGVDEQSSSDEESNPKKKMSIGSRATRKAAVTQIMKAVRQVHLHDDDYLSLGAPSGERASQLGLSQSVFDNLAMTHNTTVEFLHYFWTVYYSGNADRAGEAQNLVETLDRSLDRIKAVADSAEQERQAKVSKMKQQIEDYFQRTGKRRKFDVNTIKGGSKAVNEMVAPVIRAIKAATEQYRKVYQMQMVQAANLQLQNQA